MNTRANGRVRDIQPRERKDRARPRKSSDSRPARKQREDKPAQQPHVVSLRAFAITLALVLGLLGISQPLHQWWAQQREYRSILSQIEAAKAENEQLQGELDRWSDKSYVASQARARLHYVQPGETQFQVVDAPETESQKSEAEAVSPQGPPRPWYLVIADTADAADDPDPVLKLAPSVEVKSEE